MIRFLESFNSLRSCGFVSEMQLPTQTLTMEKNLLVNADQA